MYLRKGKETMRKKKRRTISSKDVIEVREWTYVPPFLINKEDLFVVIPSYLGFNSSILKLYDKKDGMIGVPRYYFEMDKYPPVKGKWERVEFKSNIVLRPYQKEILKEYALALKGDHPYGGIIQMPTGSGKTVVALDLARRLKLTTLVVVHRDLIFKQWIEAIKKFLGVEAGIIRGSTEDIKPITVAMVQTLIRKDSVPYKDYFGHVIYDEVHVMGAEEFNQTIPLFNPKIRTGLSATPQRRDGLSYLFQWHIGDVVAKMDKKLLTPKVLKVEFIHYGISTKDCYFRNKFLKSKYLKRLNVKRRNELVAKLVMKAYKAGYKVLVLSDSIELLKEYDKLIDVVDKAWLIGNRKTYTGRERVILATYGAGGTGFDAPDVDCVVLATPRADVKQAIGRALRPLDGKRRPLIIDIVEGHLSVMRRFFMSRKKAYPAGSIKVITV